MAIESELREGGVIEEKKVVNKREPFTIEEIADALASVGRCPRAPWEREHIVTEVDVLGRPRTPDIEDLFTDQTPVSSNQGK